MSFNLVWVDWISRSFHSIWYYRPKSLKKPASFQFRHNQNQIKTAARAEEMSATQQFGSLVRVAPLCQARPMFNIHFSIMIQFKALNKCSTTAHTSKHNDPLQQLLSTGFFCRNHDLMFYMIRNHNDVTYWTNRLVRKSFVTVCNVKNCIPTNHKLSSIHLHHKIPSCNRVLIRIEFIFQTNFSYEPWLDGLHGSNVLKPE